MMVRFMPEEEFPEAPDRPEKPGIPTRKFTPEEAEEALREAGQGIARLDALAPRVNLPLAELPGAPNLTAYLRERIKEYAERERRNRGASLSVDRRQGLEGSEVYFARMNRGMIGTYTVFSPAEGETECAKEFVFSRGDILPEGYPACVVLRWDNKKCMKGIRGDGEYTEVKTEWKRQDPFADRIPFP